MQTMFIEQINAHHSKGPPETTLVVKFSKFQLTSMHLCRTTLLDTVLGEAEVLGFALGLLSLASHL